ncbi:hypothetical protein DWB84_03220 [Saccharophagus sp. K07]|nr:hypothetical protein [Saccharophagus sp. K07]
MFTLAHQQRYSRLILLGFSSWPNFCFKEITLLKNNCCVFQNGKTLFLRFSPGFPGFFLPVFWICAAQGGATALFYRN